MSHAPTVQQAVMAGILKDINRLEESRRGWPGLDSDQDAEVREEIGGLVEKVEDRMGKLYAAVAAEPGGWTFNLVFLVKDGEEPAAVAAREISESPNAREGGPWKVREIRRFTGG